MESIVIILACLIMNSLLAAFEMAFVSVSRAELREIARDGSKTAQWVLDRRASPERTLSVIQIGITLVAAMAGAAGGMEAAESIQPFMIRTWNLTPLTAEILSILLIVLPLTYLTVVIGELVPKALALRAPVKIVLKGARWIAFADRGLSPVVTLLEWSTRKILQIFFPRPKAPETGTDTTVQIGSLTPSHQRAVVNLVSLERKLIREIFVPWDAVTYVNATDAMETVVPVVYASGHTRLPVVEDDEVVGVLHTKEFLGYRESGGTDWKRFIRPILKTKSSDNLLPVLRFMQFRHSHMAVVFGPNEERLGIVTMEDIIEAFLGDIYDEDDDSRIRKIFADRIRARGQFYNDDLNK